MIRYCEATHRTQRWKTREVMVGKLGIGKENPIRIQSMTSCPTDDVEATVSQIERLSDEGCEIVRVTVQGLKEVKACEKIRNTLIQENYSIPIVADIHFFPEAAMQVIDFVDKVRINPGNFVRSYPSLSYEEEKGKIEEAFVPLVEKCKKNHKALRIGINQGSLSKRITNRYGDTPRGMIESALEFAHICRKRDFHNFLFSMKSAHPLIMIKAYRLLVAEMISLGWNYPLHLGVTEAGIGEDGRIKSALGIGSLLLDGIGDTIRVSLTEDPWEEIKPCKQLIDIATAYQKENGVLFEDISRNIENMEKRPIEWPKTLSLHHQGSVIVVAQPGNLENSEFYKNIGYEEPTIKRSPISTRVDGIILKKDSSQRLSPREKTLSRNINIFSNSPQENECLLLPLSQAILHTSKPKAVLVEEEDSHLWAHIEKIEPKVIFLSPQKDRLHYCRQFFSWLHMKQIKTPVMLYFRYTEAESDLLIQAAVEMGALLCDGLGEGICIEAPVKIEFLKELSFSLLQATKNRVFKTEFISCPGCGRTLFNIQETTKRIRSSTQHLPGIKIAIMGCIVNGPGEMADADFGYMGSKPGKIDLYVKHQCVEKDISTIDAEKKLIDLIKKEGKWIDP